jgi:hypothetical protein
VCEAAIVGMLGAESNNTTAKNQGFSVCQEPKKSWFLCLSGTQKILVSLFVRNPKNHGFSVCQETKKSWFLCLSGTQKIMVSLFVRNLSLLASSLQGRTQYEFPLFRSRNHLTLFSIAMGLLELAR